ncbi:MAG: molybdopterin converting factor subunit 1 [Geminicoccaceae bacterium]|nr:MAG: molybdopterin converting factor subunit 1 [Geminicoccaceae bacterium]
MVRIRYFAWLRHKTGIGSEELALPDGVRTARQLGDWLAARSPGFHEAWTSTGVVRMAVNHEHVEDDVELGPDDEVAFFPPVTGG